MLAIMGIEKKKCFKAVKLTTMLRCNNNAWSKYTLIFNGNKLVMFSAFSNTLCLIKGLLIYVLIMHTLQIQKTCFRPNQNGANLVL